MAKKTLNAQPIESSLSTTKKLSLAVGFLSFAAFVIQGLGDTWGFSGVAEQLTETALLVSGGINIFFLGNTTNKINQEKKDGKN